MEYTPEWRREKCGGFYSTNTGKEWRKLEDVNKEKNPLAPIGQKQSMETNDYGDNLRLKTNSFCLHRSGFDALMYGMWFQEWKDGKPWAC